MYKNTYLHGHGKNRPERVLGLQLRRCVVTLVIQCNATVLPPIDFQSFPLCSFPKAFTKSELTLFEMDNRWR